MFKNIIHSPSLSLLLKYVFFVLFCLIVIGGFVIKNKAKKKKKKTIKPNINENLERERIEKKTRQNFSFTHTKTSSWSYDDIWKKRTEKTSYFFFCFPFFLRLFLINTHSMYLQYDINTSWKKTVYKHALSSSSSSSS